MSLTAVSAPSPVGRIALEPPLLLAWLLGIALMALSYLPVAVDTYRNGSLVDNDDAMRLVEVRQLLGGQGWFDLRQTRINPPDSPLSHWSRIIDMPLAASIGALRPWLGQERAERTVITIWPPVLAGLLLLVLLATVRTVLPPVMMLVAAVTVGFNPIILFNDIPGRIDHHGTQMLLMACLCLAACEAIFRQRRWAAEIAGGLSALTLAIGLETLPFVAVAGACFALVWIVRGATARATTGRFGAALALCTLLLAVLTLPPAGWTAPVCDALGLSSIWLAVSGGAALVGASLMPQPARLPARLAVGALLAAPAAGVFLLAWPTCLAGPYGSVDPLVMRLWLSKVGETRPVFDLLAGDPETYLFFLAFPLIGTAGLVFAAVRERARRPEFVLFLAFAAIGLVLELQQMRSASFAAIFALPGWLYVVHAAMTPKTASARARLGLAAASAVVFTASLQFPWVAAGIAAAGETTAAAPRCVVPQQDMSVLAAQPSGLVLAPVELGPRILVATRDTVLGAPYHRNNAGNRLALDVLIGTADAARERVRQRGIRYVALCAGATETTRLVAAAGPDSLVANLAAGKTPAWLAPLQQSGALQAWRVVD